MNNQNQNQVPNNGQLQTKPRTQLQVTSDFFKKDKVSKEFEKLLGARGPHFIASILSLVSSNVDLSECNQTSIYTAAMIAASMDLPVNQNLGFAWIIAYNQKQKNGTWIKKAQFQIGYKGLIQLAHRSKQYTTLHSSDVRQGELIGNDRMTGELKFEWVVDDNQRNKLPIIGYISFFRLANGFESTFYMTIEEMQIHAKRYSKTYAKNFGMWKDDFSKMAEKTITKLHLSKKGILSTDLQNAIKHDQGSIVLPVDSGKDIPGFDDIQDIEPEYIDNQDNYEDEVKSPPLMGETEDQYNERIFNEHLAKEEEQARQKELRNDPQSSGQTHGGINVSMNNLEQVIDQAKTKQKLK